VAEQGLHDPDTEDGVERGDEAVGREGEEEARLAHATQISECENEDAGERKRHLVRSKCRKNRGDREDPGRYGDGDCEHVVRQKRGGSDERRGGPEVFLREDVRPPTRLIDGDPLPVGKDDD
jgi:hypothetical protein